jgi:hypothetical protein
VPGTLTGRAVFGGFDGTTSSIGVLAGLLVAHATSGTILTTAVGLAVASMVGMAFGDWLGGATRTQAAVMGLATLAGSLLPAIPLAVNRGPLGYSTAALLVAGLAVAISETRAEHGRLRAYTTTLTTLAAASALSAGAALLVGAA